MAPVLVVHKTFIDIVDPDATDHGRARSASAPAGFRQPRVRKWIPLPVQVGDLRPQGGVIVASAKVPPVAVLDPAATLGTAEASRRDELFVCVLSNAVVIRLDTAGQPSIDSDYTVRCAFAVLVTLDYKTWIKTCIESHSDSPTVIATSIARLERLTHKHVSKAGGDPAQIANESGCL